jgi:hypothetical protein
MATVIAVGPSSDESIDPVNKPPTGDRPARPGRGEGTVEPLDVEGVRRLLSEQARRGSVPAAKALLDHQWRFEKDRAADRELDQLNALASGR